MHLYEGCAGSRLHQLFHALIYWLFNWCQFLFSRYHHISYQCLKNLQNPAMEISPSSKCASHSLSSNAFPSSPLLVHVHLFSTTGAGRSDSCYYFLFPGFDVGLSHANVSAYISLHMCLHWKHLCYSLPHFLVILSTVLMNLR